MERLIHRDKRFEDALAGMKAKGGRTAAVAEKAEALIASMQSNPQMDPLSLVRLTRNGESRIEDCVKFDLGGGYRIVILAKGRHVVFLHIGTHDECFRWINRNRGVRFEVGDADGVRPRLVEKESAEEVLPPDVLEEREFVLRYEEQFMRSLDEGALRRVFGEWFARPAAKLGPAGPTLDRGR